MLQGWVQIAVFFAVLVALTPLIGAYMARVFTGERVFLSPVLGPIERLTYRVLRVRPDEGQDWKGYARSLIAFSLLFWIALYLILRTQGIQPFNPEGFHSGPWDLSFNTTSSFITNTNWQYYGGETTLTYFAQMAGLAVQNFVSAAVGIAVVVALIRGIVSRSGKQIGNFWEDLVRTLLYILVPISVIGALFLVSQGVIQNIGDYALVHTLTGGTQTLAQGPVASQEVIKELGTNGGGFFNVNSSMPFENPTGLTNFFEMLLILVIPAGAHLHLRHAWSAVAARAGRSSRRCSVLFVAGVAVVYHRRAARHPGPARRRPPHPRFRWLDRRQHGGQGAALRDRRLVAVGGGDHGHVLRRGQRRLRVADRARRRGADSPTSASARWSSAESAAGLYSMLLYVLLAVFIGGLMVGRTPEYLGKKIQAREIKLVSLGVLFTPLAVLMSAGLASATRAGTRSIFAGINPQGFSETLYAYLSQANNNGSAFAGYTGFVQPNAPGNAGAYGISFADLLGGATMTRRPLRPDHLRPRRRRLACRQEGLAGRPRDDADRQPDLRRPADRRRHPGRRPHLLPRPPARTDRPEPDHEAVLMMRRTCSPR